MTPDMKRLCEAAWKVEEADWRDAFFCENGYDDAPDNGRKRLEAIVRAVLLALRDASKEMLEAGEAGVRQVPGWDDDDVEFDNDGYLPAVIDYLLASYTPDGVSSPAWVEKIVKEWA